jgi:hypothetical protein
MSDIGNFIEGRGSSAARPFHSFSFVLVSILGLGSVGFDVYLIFRHWRSAPAYVAAILSMPIGIQLIYQWFRVLRYRAKIRELYSKGSDAGSGLNPAVVVAVRGMIDILFFSYGIALFALILIGLLLSRLEGL